jgi:hypothetical protein
MLRRPETELIAEVREALRTDGFDRAFAAGSRLSRQEAAAVAHDDWPSAGTRAA